MADDLNQRNDVSGFRVGVPGPMLRRFLLACAAAAALCHAGAALAETFPLGVASSPTTFAIGNEGLRGAFSDVFSFEIGAAGPLEFESSASTGFSNRWAIPDLQAALYSNGALLVNGIAQTLFSPEGFPSREVGFAPLVLGAGKYELLFGGTATSFDPGLPITSSYVGTIALAQVSAIPEPATIVLTAMGVVTMIALRRRRSDDA